LQNEFDIDIKWTAFPLHPETPEEGLTLEELFAGRPVDIKQVLANLSRTAKDLGLPFGKREKTYNSRLAQELGKWAESMGKGAEYHRAVYHAFFVKGCDIGSAPILADLAEEIGLSGKEAKRIAAARPFKDAVDTDWARSLEVDPDYVPSLMVGNNLLVNPQEYSLWEQFMIENNVKTR
jgi:predicted DsbA family dithiol-disulfide isomerase